jgi:hypothetical protein
VRPLPRRLACQCMYRICCHLSSGFRVTVYEELGAADNALAKKLQPQVKNMWLVCAPPYCRLHMPRNPASDIAGNPTIRKGC